MSNWTPITEWLAPSQRPYEQRARLANADPDSEYAVEERRGEVEPVRKYRIMRRPRPSPCFVIALGFSCAYFVNVDAKHGGYPKDALVFEHRSAAENYINIPWMASFRPCHVVETTRQKIDENRAMHASFASKGVL